jgi:thiamine-phosphate pyrophosphorylase
VRQERRQRLREADLYLVTSEPLSKGRSDLEILDAALAAGVRLIQLRDKTSNARDLFEKACEFRRRTAEAGALLIINDRVDLAAAVGADGVHLGQNDLPVNVARKLLPDGLIGASTHNVDQAVFAEIDGADYVNIGPIYPTATKEGLVEFLGPEAISRATPHLSIPFTVMGGIKLHHVEELISAGANILALVTAVTAAPDPEAAARELREAMPSSQRGTGPKPAETLPTAQFGNGVLTFCFFRR